MSRITDAQRSLAIIIEAMTDQELFQIAERLKAPGWSWQAFLLEQELRKREQQRQQ